MDWDAETRIIIYPAHFYASSWLTPPLTDLLTLLLLLPVSLLSRKDKGPTLDPPARPLRQRSVAICQHTNQSWWYIRRMPRGEKRNKKWMTLRKRKIRKVCKPIYQSIILSACHIKVRQGKLTIIASLPVLLLISLLSSDWIDQAKEGTMLSQ